MSIGLIIFLALIGIPLIEIAVFIEVGGPSKVANCGSRNCADRTACRTGSGATGRGGATSPSVPQRGATISLFPKN